MMKHLLYSDTHWRQEKINDLIYVHKEIYKIAESHQIISSGGLVINGGDTFHVRGFIPTDCWDALVQARINWNDHGITHVDIVGNHDQADKVGTIHPMKIFETFSNGYVYDKPSFNKKFRILFIPFMVNLNSWLTSGNLIEISDCSEYIVVCHAPIKGAFMNDHHKDTDGIDVGLFKQFKRVFSGHYHKRHMIGNVQYIGSPLQQDYSEMGQNKGVLIYDTEKDAVEFVEIKGTAKHYEVNVEWDDDGKIQYESPKSEDKDYVRLNLKGSKEHVYSTNQDKFEIKGSVKINREILSETVSRIDIGSDLTHNTLITQYVDHVDPSLDKSKLLKIGRELINAKA